MLRSLNGFSCSDCETTWLLGQAGECNLTEEICICPEGYSGIDFMTVTQTCHVPEALASGLYLTGFIFSLFSLVVTFICLIMFLKVSSNSYHKGKVNHIQNLTLQAYYGGLVYLLATVVTFGFFVFSDKVISFRDYKVILPALVGLICISQSVTYTITYLAWYSSMPDAEAYGKLLGYPDFIQRNPKFIPHQIYFTLSFWIVFGIVCFGILPLVDDEDRYGATPASIFLIFLVPLSLFAFIIFFLTLTLLKRLYMNARRTAQKANDKRATGTTINGLNEQLTDIEAALNGLQIIRPVAIIVFTPSLVIGLISLFSGGLYQYLLLTWIASSLSIGIVTIAVITAQNTNGGYMLRQPRHSVS